MLFHDALGIREFDPLFAIVAMKSLVLLFAAVWFSSVNLRFGPNLFRVSPCGKGLTSYLVRAALTSRTPFGHCLLRAGDAMPLIAEHAMRRGKHTQRRNSIHTLRENVDETKLAVELADYEESASSSAPARLADGLGSEDDPSPVSRELAPMNGSPAPD